MKRVKDDGPIKPYIPKRTRKPKTPIAESNYYDFSLGAAYSISHLNHKKEEVTVDEKEALGKEEYQAKVVSMNKIHPPPLKQHQSKIPTIQICRCQAHQKAITSARWSFCKENILLTSSLDKDIKIWKYQGKKLNLERCITAHSEGVKDARWSVDGNNILSASFDKTTKIIDMETGTSKSSYVHDDMVTSAIFHGSNEQLFLAGTFSSGIYAWDLRQAKSVKHFKSSFGQVQDLLFLPDNETFLSSAESAKRNSLDKTIVAWDFKTTAVMSNQIYQEPFSCTSLRLHPSNKTFLAQSAAGYIVLFNSVKPWKMNKYKRFQGHTAGGYHVGFDVTPDGRVLYTGDTNGNFFAYDYYTSNVSKKEKLFTSPCVAVACSPYNASTTCFASWDGAIALWD